MHSSKTLLYVWRSPYPWDVRIEKICKSFRDDGYNVVILCRWGGEEIDIEQLDDMTIHRVGFKEGNLKYIPISQNPFWYNAIEKAVKLYQPNVIMPREIMLAEACGNIAKKYNIVSIMDMAEHYPAAMRGWKKYYDNLLLRVLVHYLKVPDWVEKRAVRVTDAIIVVTEELKLRVAYRYKFNPNKISVITNTPFKKWFSKVKSLPRIPAVNFAYHGHLTPDRNIELLIRAFLKASKNNNNITLTIAGAGESFDECKSIADNDSNGYRVKFLGAYQHNQIEELYSKTDIAVLPFKVNEFINHIIANKIFDYMACGKPLIVSNAKPMTKLIEETGSGFIFENEAELVSIMENINSYDLEAIGKNGIKAFEEKYNWEEDSKKMLNFVNKILEKDN